MNEKKYRVIIAILAIIAVVAVGFSIYFARPISNSATGQGILDSADRQRELITSLQSDLSAAHAEIESGLRDTDRLELGLRDALGIAEQSAGGFAELGVAMAANGNTITELINKQRRINEIAGRILKDYSRLTESLRDSLGENK